MKKIILLISLVGMFCSNLVGQVTNVELLDTYSTQEIQGIISSFGLPPGIIPLQFPVDFYRVSYMTEHPNGSEVEVSGALCLPSGVNCQLALSSYQHGTIAKKTDAPSFQSDEGMLGVMYASAGYVSVMADYIGLGISEGLHPYVHADSEAQACFDLLNAAVSLQTDLGFDLNGQLFLWGYSQGGHATMALQRKIELEASTEFEITASAPMSGPYNISGVQADVLTSDQYYPTPGYLPYVILGYQEAYGDLYNNLEEVFLPQYASPLPTWFNGTYSMGYINNQCPNIPSEMLQPDFIAAYESDPNHPIRLALQDNDLLDWAPQVTTQLLYCIGDDQVSYENSLVAEQAYIDLGSTTVEAIDLGNYNHSGCAPFAMLLGFNLFESLRAPFFNPSITSIITPSTGQSNGMIALTIESDEAYTYIWSNGAETLINSGLDAGDYTLTILGEQGCSVTYTFNVDLVDGIYEFISEDGYFPNPTEGILNLKVPATTAFELMDMTGRIVLVAKKGATQIDLTALPDGVYFVRRGNDKPIKVVKQ